jgi:hypothetical protein
VKSERLSSRHKLTSMMLHQGTGAFWKPAAAAARPSQRRAPFMYDAAEIPHVKRDGCCRNCMNSTGCQQNSKRRQADTRQTCNSAVPNPQHTPPPHTHTRTHMRRNRTLDQSSLPQHGNALQRPPPPSVPPLPSTHFAAGPYSPHPSGPTPPTCA